MKKSVYIIGGGAAGFFCAINMAEQYPEYSITILEKSSKLLSKVRVSGGGRCNTTHFCFDNNQLIQNYPRGYKELKAVFARFSVKHTIEWFAKRDVRLLAEEDGRMFPESNSSQTIINCFLDHAAKNHVRIATNMDVEMIEPQSQGFILRIKNEHGLQNVSADLIVVATGGFPMKKGYDFLSGTKHQIVSPVPSLYTFNLPGNEITQLMGVAVKNALIKVVGTKYSFSGPLLITHWGLSGPAVLKLSAFAADYFHTVGYKAAIMVNWLNSDQEEVRSAFAGDIFESKSLPKNTNIFGVPKRLWEFLLLKAGFDLNTAWNETAKKKKNKLIELLTADIYHMEGKTTFKEEFVTCGGVPLNEIDCRRMESKLHPGLFFAGEVLNIDGITGGFNFQAAWSTSWIVAQSAL